MSASRASAPVVREPAAVKRRPRYKGLPVPFTVFVDAQGVPDFKVIEPRNHRRCLDERLCGICGARIGRFVCFVGGPKSMASGHFIDAPMHEACARYAFSVCPFLAGRSVSYAEHIKDHGPDVRLNWLPGEQNHRPDRMGLYVTESYRPPASSNQPIQAGEAHRITWLD